MNTTQIKCFISLGKTNNFSQTAKELFLTQPSVSKNIHNLEKELGVKLVTNKSRKVFLTAAGRYFYEKICNIDQQVDQIIKNTKNYQTYGERTVIIGYSGIPFEQKFLPIFIKIINKKGNWHIKLNRISLAKNNVNTALENRKIDFMLYQSDFFNDSLYEFVPFFKAGFSVITSKEDPLSKNKRITIPELKNRNIYLWNGKTPLQSVIDLKNFLIEKLKISDNKIHIINQASLAKIIVSSKTGTAIVPSFVYDYNNEDVNYQLLDYDQVITYGVGYLAKTKNQSCFSEIISALSLASAEIINKWK